MERVFLTAYTFVGWFVQIMTLAIILRAIFSWFNPSLENPIFKILYEVTEPMLAPLRRVIPSMGMLDLSPFVAMILLSYVVGPILQRVLFAAAMSAAP